MMLAAKDDRWVYILMMTPLLQLRLELWNEQRGGTFQRHKSLEDILRSMKVSKASCGEGKVERA